MYGLVVRCLFVSKNGIKMPFLGVVGFKISTLNVYCLSSWFVHQKRKTYSNLCVLCRLIHLSWFQGPKYIPPSCYVGLDSQIMMLCKKCQQSDFLGHCSFTQFFHDVEKLRRKPKIFVKIIQRFWYVQHKKFILLKIHQKQPKLPLW